MRSLDLLRFALAAMASIATLVDTGAAGAQELAPPQTGAVSATAPRAETATWPLAARDLARGETLAREDILRVAAPADEEGEAPGALVGWTTRRVISKGEPLLPPAVAPPDLVKAGEPVEAVFRGRTVVLRVRGTAAGSAALGERVLVRVDARRRLEGVVIGPALVELESSQKGR